MDKEKCSLTRRIYSNDLKTTLQNIPGQLIFEEVELQRLSRSKIA